MNEVYIECLKKYLESITDLEKNILVLEDIDGIMDSIEDIDLYLYPHKVINVKENVVFRSRYENIKHKKDEKHIVVLKNKDLSIKLLDFIKRAERGRIIPINMNFLLDSIESDVKWNERISQFSADDIKKKFRELLYYRKLLKKNNIEKEDVDKIVLSTLVDLDATKIKDDVDCYLYYRNLREIYSDFDKFNYKTSIKEILVSVFADNGSLISTVISNDVFDVFENLMWISLSLEEINKLNSNNIKLVMGQDFNYVSYFESHLQEIVDFTRLINKRDKKLYIKKKDAAEKLIYKSGINIYGLERDYKTIIREGNGTYISIIESIKTLIKNFNLEGAKKVYKYNLDNLVELKILIDESNNYATENVGEIKDTFRLMITFLKDIEYIEKQVNYISNDYTQWDSLYKNYLCNMQYNLSKIKYLDNHNIIEDSRYKMLDKRVSKILNEYRRKFAIYVKENYKNWSSVEYGISRPILNSDIYGLLNLKDNKTFIIIFDGMRYDAWENIVKPYFEKVLIDRNTKYKNSYALLPSITSISRDAIYKNIVRDYKDDLSYITKSESVRNTNILSESILQDKKVNIFVFNMFDRDGHKATEDLYIFYDKQRKVFEKGINDLIKMIPEDSNIVITSDHGLMRIDENINMKEEVFVETVKSRYLTSKEPIEKDGFININGYLLSYDNKGYFLGGGEKDFYSHGGASIEEIIVPLVISETKISKNSKELIPEKPSLSFSEKEIFKLDDNISLKLSFKLGKKEEIILNSLYNLKNKNLSNKDIEKILKNKTGRVGMIEIIIRKLIRNLKNDKYNIIEESSAGELIIYKFDEKGLNGGI